ncbi:FkbM family methyltransferase [Seonamhaeicola sp. MEBiC1930]|uniref:FkbM family methyltransferase n=1 Tax=Seonamhaeicola sp. MEBiC01930 TaxID=2976768 RepID=UPI0032497BA0
MKKLLIKLLPKVLFEYLKLAYYNLKIKKYSFSYKKGNYITKEKGLWSVESVEPFYFLVDDIDKYEKYYKIKAGDVVLDAGAHHGGITVIYSQKVKQEGKVFSFEPDSRNLAVFNKNLDVNSNYNNVEVIEKGLWNKEDTLEFFEAGNVGSSIFYEGEQSKKVTIQTTSIDNFLNEQNNDKLSFIKMDIEGAEIEALEGAVNSIKKFKPNFAIASYHIVNNVQTYFAVEEFFKSINYPYKTESFKDGEIITYAGSSVE